MRRLISIAVAAAFCAVAAQAGSASPGESWAGEMRQIEVDGESKYPMTLTLKGKTGGSSYPTLKCAGVWTRIGVTKDGYAIYHEKVVNEPGATCIDGVFTARKDADKLIIGWFGVYDGKPGLASATLGRKAN